MARVITVPLLSKQKTFIESTERFCLYSGAWRAGKTRSLCYKAYMRASRPGARESLVRKHLVTLKDTTLRTLLEPEAGLPPVIPEGTYIHNAGRKTINIHGGGEIVYFGLDDPRKIGSRTLSGVNVDEAAELTEKDWDALRGRISMKIPGLCSQMNAATNPDVPTHFLAQRFGLAMDYKPVPHHVAIRTKATDNTFLSKDYLDDIMQLKGLAFNRYVLGKWVGSDRLVYDNWDRDVFVAEREPYGDPIWRRCIVGADDGHTNPATFIVILEDYDGRIHIAEEWYHTRQLPEEKVAAAKEIYERVKPTPERFEVDPSAAGYIASLRAAGIPAYGAKNDVPTGLDAVRDSLVVPADGRPRQTVSPRCFNTKREYETYENKEGTDTPIDKHNHALDAVRYGKVKLDEGKASVDDDWGEYEPSEALAEFGDLGESDAY